jgi:hypothetical protein
MNGGWLKAIAVVIEVLSLGFASGDAELALTVLMSGVPVPTGHSTIPIIVITACPPAGSDVNVAVMSAPEPSHTPPVVDEHENRLTPAGRLSVTTTDRAGSGPAFLTVIVYMTAEATSAYGDGKTVWVRERSEDCAGFADDANP